MNVFRKVLMPLSAALLTTVLMPTSSAAASCGDGANVPAGSYRQSCTSCVASGGDLTASCKKMNGQPNNTTLYKFQSCRSGIENMDGYLTCARGDGALPNGSYKASCRNLNVEKNTLYATCRNVNGEWKEASLPLGYCNYEIYNTNGALACTLPYGTYQRSCRNARVQNGQLYAECKTRSGDWARTVAPAACSRDLANDNGMLKCL
jgi:CVNH domain